MTPYDRPGPLQRRGPRPLLLHLTLAMLRSSASLAGLPNSNAGWAAWSAALAQQARGLPEGAPPLLSDPLLSEAVLREVVSQDSQLIAGIAAYRRHPWTRTLADPPSVWAEGGSRILDFGGAGPPVLFVPSLVNRAHVLDLTEERSMLRHLSGQGMHPLLLDWGWPGEIERQFTLTDYVAGRLERALAALGEPVVLAGYCMGGLLAVAAAQRQPERVRALALLATPWDFHQPDAAAARRLAEVLPLLEPAIALTGTVPIDALQMLFAMLDPWGIAEKYRGFARLDPESERARMFVALEDWLNDGVPLAAPVARDCLQGWYGANTPMRGTWRIAGEAIDPARLHLPCFVAAPGRDRIVPPESAAPLAGLIPGAVLHTPKAGHVGMVAGANAARVLWEPLATWIRKQAALF